MEEEEEEEERGGRTWVELPACERDSQATEKSVSPVVQIDLTVIKWAGRSGARERARGSNAVIFT